MKKIVLLTLLFLLGPTSGMAQAKSDNSEQACYRWRTQVDPQIQRINIEETALSDSEVEEGIRCLLELKGQKAKARFYGDTRANYNKADRYRPPKKPATVEIAALYYISYLFENNWEHAGSVVLVDDDGKLNSNAIVEKAYKSYREWFQKVLKVGLRKARELKLDPLEGSGVRWL